MYDSYKIQYTFIKVYPILNVQNHESNDLKFGRWIGTHKLNFNCMINLDLSVGDQKPQRNLLILWNVSNLESMVYLNRRQSIEKSSCQIYSPTLFDVL